MHCRDAQRLLSAERDGMLEAEQRDPLERHVAICPACRLARAEFAAIGAALRTAAADVTVPDADEEWETLRARLRVSETPRAASRPRRRLAPITWLGLPLAAAAAFAFLLLNRESGFGSDPDASAGSELARAEYVNVNDANASTMVYVDKDSGWLVVWAMDDKPAQG